MWSSSLRRQRQRARRPRCAQLDRRRAAPGSSYPPPVPASRPLVACLPIACLLASCATLPAPRSEASTADPLDPAVAALFLEAQLLLEQPQPAGSDDRSARAAALLERAAALQPDSAPLQRYVGQAWAALPDHARAIEAATRALALDPADARAQLLLGDELFRAGRLDEAEAHLREAARRGVDGVAASQPHERLFDLLRTLGRADAAVAALDAWIAALPEDRRPATIKADYLWDLGRPEEAQKAAAVALLVDADSGPAQRIVADFCRLDPASEAEVLEAALAADWSAHDLHERLVDVYERMGRYDRALAHLRYVGMLGDEGPGAGEGLLPPGGPGSAEHLALRARLLGRMHRHEDAVSLLRDALAASQPPATELRLVLAEAHRAGGELDAALLALEPIGPGDPAWGRSALLEARILMDRHEPGAAAEAARAARDLIPPDDARGRAALAEAEVRALIDAGQAEAAGIAIAEPGLLSLEAARKLEIDLLRHRGQLPEAIAREERAIEESPFDLALRVRLAELLAEAGDLARAIDACDAGLATARDWEQALLREAAPGQAWSIRQQALGDTAWLLLRRAFLEQESGSSARAEATLLLVLDLLPRDADALNSLAYHWAQEGRELDRAEAMARQAVEQRPFSAAIVDTMGWVRFRQGHAQEARKLLEQAAAWMPDDPEIQGHLGDVLMALGERGAALDAWQRALAGASTAHGARPAAQAEALRARIREARQAP